MRKTEELSLSVEVLILKVLVLLEQSLQHLEGLLRRGFLCVMTAGAQLEAYPKAQGSGHGNAKEGFQGFVGRLESVHVFTKGAEPLNILIEGRAELMHHGIHACRKGINIIL